MLRELLASFNIDTAQATAAMSKIDVALEKTSSTLGALASAFVGSAIVHGMSEFISHQIEAGSRVNDLSERLGVGVEELQSFQFAAGLAGVGSEEAAKGLQFLNKNIGEAIGGNKEAVETFAKLGIELKDAHGGVRETGDILPEVADKFAELGSDAERTALAMKIFGKAGAGLIPLLKHGAEGLTEMQAEFERLGGGMSKEFVAAADEAGDEIDKLKFGLNNFKSQIAFAILPLITRGAQKFQDLTVRLIRLNKETHLAKASWVVFGAASSAASAKAAVGFAKLLGVVPKDAGFWKTVLGLGEIVLVAALVALVALAFEDLFTLLTGGDSVIGDVIDGLFGVGASKQFVVDVKKAFAELHETVDAFKPLLDELSGSFGGMWPYIMFGIKSVAKFMVGSLAFSLRLALQIIKSAISQMGVLIDGVGGIATAAGEMLGNDTLKNAGASLTKTGALVGLANKGTVPESQVFGGERPMPPDFNQKNEINVNVQGGKDPAATGKAVETGVRDALGPHIDTALAATLGSG